MSKAFTEEPVHTNGHLESDEAGNNNIIRKNLEEIVSNSIQVEEALEIAEKKIFTRAEKKEQIIKILHQSTSSGDEDTVYGLLNHPALSEFIDVNAIDEDGAPPLVYASSFGYTEVARHLLIAGAKVDMQDKNGWPPLMWATNNQKDEIVKLLLEYGASPTTKTAKGRTVLDIINHGLADNNAVEKSAKLQEILSYNHTSTSKHRTHKSLASFSSFNLQDFQHDDDNASLNSWAYTDPEGDHRNLMRQTNEKLGQLELLGNSLEDMIQSENYGYNEDSLEELTNEEFVWDQCLPDQMFVFSSQHIPHIIGTVITTMSPVYAKDQKSVPANVIFLCSRFAFYFSTPDLLEELLKSALKAIADCVKAHYNEIKFLAFWLANSSQLLYYLKKDCGLVASTVEHQLALSELIHEVYQLLVRDAQARISNELTPAILECDSIPGLSDETKFKPARKGFLATIASLGESENTGSLRKRLSLRRRAPASLNYAHKRRITPESIADILSSTLSVLQLYQVHPMLVHHVLNQLVYFISTELFNRILDTEKYCSRTRAIQIRMNVTVLEDWIRQHSNSPLVQNLATHFKTLLHLLQFLQCFSAHRSLAEFIETLQTLDTLTPLQIQLIVETYRYENDEERVADEVLMYIQQVANRVLDRKDKAASKMKKDGTPIVIVRDLDDEVTTRITRRVSFLSPNPNSSNSRSPSISRKSSRNTSPDDTAKPNLRVNNNESSASVNSLTNGINDISITIQPPTNCENTPIQSQTLLNESTGYPNGIEPPPSPTHSRNTSTESTLQPFVHSNLYSVFKDPNHLLPFSVPTQSDMVNGWNTFGSAYTYDNNSGPNTPPFSSFPIEGNMPGSPLSGSFANDPTIPNHISDSYVPTIPEKFVDLLDTTKHN